MGRRATRVRHTPCILFLRFLSTHPSQITEPIVPTGDMGRPGAVVTREALTRRVVLLFLCMVREGREVEVLEWVARVFAGILLAGTSC